MAQRTIAEARQLLSDNAPQLNPEVWGRMDREVKAAEQAAMAKAHSFIDQRFVEASVTGNEVVTDLCSIRDEANALVAATRAGQLSAAEANKTLNDLRAEYRRLDRSASVVAHAAETIEAIEGDPVGWADSINQKFPNICPSFSF